MPNLTAVLSLSFTSEVSTVCSRPLIFRNCKLIEPDQNRQNVLEQAASDVQNARPMYPTNDNLVGNSKGLDSGYPR